MFMAVFSNVAYMSFIRNVMLLCLKCLLTCSAPNIKFIMLQEEKEGDNSVSILV